MKNDKAGITEMDAAEYAAQLRDMYGVWVCVELEPGGYSGRPSWRVVAKAYQVKEDASLRLLMTASGLYPSVNHKTFGGACLWALMKLQDRLHAQEWLTQLPLPL